MVPARSEVFISAENQPWSPLEYWSNTMSNPLNSSPWFNLLNSTLALEFGVEWGFTPSTVNSELQLMYCLNHKKKPSQILVQRRNEFEKAILSNITSPKHRSPLQIDIISNLAPTCHISSITQRSQVKLQPLHIPLATSNALYNILPPLSSSPALTHHQTFCSYSSATLHHLEHLV